MLAMVHSQNARGGSLYDEADVHGMLLGYGRMLVAAGGVLSRGHDVMSVRAVNGVRNV
jgi:hypothetical protein